MKKFRKRKEDESRWQYLNFLLLTFWPLTLLAQIVLSGIYCGILILTSYSTHYTLLMSIVVVAFFMLIVLDNHDKDKPWGAYTYKVATRSNINDSQHITFYCFYCYNILSYLRRRKPPLFYY